MPRTGGDVQQNDEKAQKREAKQEEKKRKVFLDAKYKTLQNITTEMKKTCPKILERKYPKRPNELDSEIEKVLKGLQDFILNIKEKLIEERRKEFNPRDYYIEKTAGCWRTRKRPKVRHDEAFNHQRQKSEATKSNDSNPKNKTESQTFWLTDDKGKGATSHEMVSIGKQSEPEPDYPSPYSRYHQTMTIGEIDERQSASHSGRAGNEMVEVKRDKQQWTNYENMELEYKEKIHKLQKTVDELNQEINSLTQENGKLQKKLENKKRQYASHSEGARKEIVEVARDTHQWAKNENVEKDYKEKIQNLQQNVERLKEDIDMLTQDKSSLQKKLEGNETWSKNLEQTNETLKRELQEMCDELQNTRQLKEHEKHLWNKKQADLITKIESLDGHVKKLTFEKNDALTRLSELAGRRLVENNPAIADLSTEIRPTKIGENFMQVYDNEWTDAFEELQESESNDDICISILLEIAKGNFDLATQFAKEFREKLFFTISCFPAELQTGSVMKQSNTTEKGTKDEEQLINQLKRVSAARTMKSIQEFVRRSRDTKKRKYGEKCERYSEKCLEMCWYMAIQSPPLALIFEVKRLDPFDDRYFKKFVTTGDKFDFVVWPCILLHKDGPILAKGVAQAMKTDSAKKNFSESAVRKESIPPQNTNVKESPLGKREAELHMKPQERKESNPRIQENPPGKKEAELPMKTQEHLQMRQGKDEKQSRQKAKSFHGEMEKAQNKTDFRTTIHVNVHSTQF